MTFRESTLQNRGFCTGCDKIVPLRHVTRDGKVYLLRECPDCGQTETLVSTNADRYYEKRNLLNYEGEAEKSCSLRCFDCNIHKAPTLVFLDVTNRCNMNCPICLANITSMGFRFDPPLDYFRKVFAHVSEFRPKPKIQLFGGEPTVREDLLDIIDLAQNEYGLSARVVTNGLRLANEEYAKKLLAKGVQLMFSFDGRDPKIYDSTRKHSRALELKMKALENIRKHGKAKVTLMTCVSEGFNDFALADLIDFCHEGRDYIAAMDLMPLTATWGPEAVEAQSATIEDVERVMKKAVPGLDFFPSGVLHSLHTLRSIFDMGSMTFGGAHPNCESISVMISDGEKYHPLSNFLTRPLKEVADELLKLDERLGRELDKALMVKLFGEKGRRFAAGLALWRFAKRNLDHAAVFGAGSKQKKMASIVLGLLKGQKAKLLLRQHTRLHGVLRLIVLPFEDKDCVEAARLVDCPANFAYEHPETREIRTMPLCAWVAYKNDILRETAKNYGVERKVGDDGFTGLEDMDSEEAAAR